MLTHTCLVTLSFHLFSVTVISCGTQTITVMTAKLFSIQPRRKERPKLVLVGAVSLFLVFDLRCPPCFDGCFFIGKEEENEGFAALKEEFPLVECGASVTRCFYWIKMHFKPLTE